MKRFTILTAAALTLGLAALPPATFAQSSTGTVTEAAPALTKATFYVENMTCALCPVTVKAAMRGVAGVRSVQVDFPARTAHVLFDPDVTTADAISAASFSAGYPADERG